MLTFIVFLIVGYLCGSLSSAILVCKAMGLPDPRTQGSNNPGATNVMRIGGKKAAYTTFVGDFLKGFLPVLIAKIFTDEYGVAGAEIGALLGHMYPLYFGFKGGKGVATLVGIIFAISPIIFAIVAVFWLAVLMVTGYVSLASMISAAVAAIVAWLLGYAPITVLALFAQAALVIYRHRENIQRLKNGTENHFRKKKS